MRVDLNNWCPLNPRMKYQPPLSVTIRAWPHLLSISLHIAKFMQLEYEIRELPTLWLVQVKGFILRHYKSILETFYQAKSFFKIQLLQKQITSDMSLLKYRI